MRKMFFYRSLKKNTIPHRVDVLHYLLLLLAIVIGYSSLFCHPIIHDFFNEFFPQRFFQINSVRHGIFPLWNPYQSMGIPAHADPQATTFYMPVYLFALFGEYSSFSCSVELILHIFVGAVGFYYLTQYFVDNKRIALLSGVIYSMSGFFVGNSMHLSWIIAGAWMPWLITYTLKILEIPNLADSIKCAIVASFLFSGGYPGFFIGFSYFFILLFSVRIIKDFKNENYHKIKNVILFASITIFLFLLLSIPSLLSFIEAQKLITRGENLLYSQISNDFPSLLSLFIPYSVNNESSIFSSDITMRSLYVGVVTIFFAVVGLKENKNTTLWLLLSFAVISLLISYGKHLPFHKLAFYVLPLFKLIRIPTLMRLFFIIVVILFAAKGMDSLSSTFYNKSKRGIFFCIFTFLVALFGFFFTHYYLKSYYVNETFTLSFYKKLEFDLIFFVIVLLSVVLLQKFFSSRINIITFSVIIVVDLVLHVFISGQYTIYNKNITHSDLKNITEDRGWPVPEKLTNAVELIHKHNAFMIWQNAGCFFKEPEWFSYNPFILKRMSSLKDFYKERNQNISLPIVFMPKVIERIAEDEFPQNLLNTDTAYILDDFSNYSTDTFFYDNSSSQIKLEHYKPGLISVRFSAEKDLPIVLAQSFTPSWICKMDNSTELDIIPINNVMMSVFVPKGNHIVEFYYQRPLLMFFWTVQIIIFILSLLFIVVMVFKQK